MVEERKIIDTGDNASGQLVDAENSKKEDVKWMVVYTAYGYGEVDFEEFKKSIQETTAKMKEVNESISEYLYEKHKELRDQKDAEAKISEVADESVPSEPANSAAVAGASGDKDEKSADQKDQNSSAAAEEKEKAEAEKKQEEDKLQQEKQKKEEEEQAKRNEQDLDMIRSIMLSEEQKKSLKEIYKEIVYVKFRWGGQGYVKRTSIKSKISVNIKTLHGERKTHKVDVSIIDLVSKIKEKLAEIEPEEMKKYPNVKFVHPMGQIKILPLDQSIESQNLKHESTLVLMGMQSFCFNPDIKDAGIEIDEAKLKATRSNSVSGSQHLTVFCTAGFSSGSNYWQVEVNSQEGQNGVFVGAAIKQDPLTLGSLKEIYGVIAPDDKLFYRWPSSSNWAMPHYGNRKQPGDKLGILLEFNEEGYGKMTLFKNGKLLGTPYTKIRPGTYYPLVSLAGGKNVVTLEPNASVPVQPYTDSESLVCPPTKEFPENGGGGEEEEEEE